MGRATTSGRHASRLRRTPLGHGVNRGNDLASIPQTLAFATVRRRPETPRFRPARISARGTINIELAGTSS